MTVNSKVNPNFPIPGIDQSSRGFRDNFATIKEEIENLQTKQIQLTGTIVGGPAQIGDGTGDVVIETSLNITNVPAAGSNLSIQINDSGLLAGSNMFWVDNKVGINTSLPAYTLHVIGNANIAGTSNTASLFLGPNFEITSETNTSNIIVNDLKVIQFTHQYGNVGIGTAPSTTFDVFSVNGDVAHFIAGKDVNDNTIRFSTSNNSTAGVVLEQVTANKLGGMRIDQSGNVSIHVNESSGANLSDASRVINILTNNNVGIGSMIPQKQLDVQGNVKITGQLEFSNASVNSGIVFPDGSFQTVAGGGGTTSSSTRSLTLDDIGRYIVSTTAGSETITLPTDLALAWPVGARTSIVLTGAGTVSISPDIGVSLYLAGIGTTGARTLATYGLATIVKIAADTWYISGDGIS